MTPKRIAELRGRIDLKDPTLQVSHVLTRDLLALLDLASTALTAREDALREAAEVVRQWERDNGLASGLRERILDLIRRPPMTYDERIEAMARAICKSRSCNGMNCCEWPANMGLRHKCTATVGFRDAARAADAIAREAALREAARVAQSHGNDRNIEQNDNVDRALNIARRDEAFEIQSAILALIGDCHD